MGSPVETRDPHKKHRTLLNESVLGGELLVLISMDRCEQQQVSSQVGPNGEPCPVRAREDSVLSTCSAVLCTQDVLH